ncbi:hypothetical protein ACFV24_19370 [Nocardia fluminea]|uniref:hypothetical protein n=1 Tax=Nocardia fluminea TaxID=134984 RepID=UPI00366ED8DC
MRLIVLDVGRSGAGSVAGVHAIPVAISVAAATAASRCLTMEDHLVSTTDSTLMSIGYRQFSAHR